MILCVYLSQLVEVARKPSQIPEVVFSTAHADAAPTASMQQ